MEKQTRISYLLFGLCILSNLLHNPAYSIFGYGYEKVRIFLFISNVVFALFFVSVFFNVITYIKKGKPKDLWKLGWLGFFGVLWLFLPLREFYSLIGFFGFFGLMEKTKQ